MTKKTWILTFFFIKQQRKNFNLASNQQLVLRFHHISEHHCHTASLERDFIQSLGHP